MSISAFDVLLKLMQETPMSRGGVLGLDSSFCLSANVYLGRQQVMTQPPGALPPMMENLTEFQAPA